jgi:hypothetical protein
LLLNSNRLASQIGNTSDHEDSKRRLDKVVNSKTSHRGQNINEYSSDGENHQEPRNKKDDFFQGMSLLVPQDLFVWSAASSRK